LKRFAAPRHYVSTTEGLAGASWPRTERHVSIHKKKDGPPQPVVPPDVPEPALPPPDDPLARHGPDADAGDRDAARRRLEAILQTRRMPTENDEPEKPDGS
jgi:hypothetical protein